MREIDFFIPVSFTNPDKSIGQLLLEAADDYFYLGGRKAQVIAIKSQEKFEYVHIEEGKSSFFATAFKVISYFTLVLPVLFLALKACLRSRYRFVSEEDKAAAKMQRVVRKFLSHLKQNCLDFNLFKEAKTHCESLSTLRKLPKALHGKTDVYLPKDLLVVLKCSGEEESAKRFRKMILARGVCDGNGYRDLVIPKARLYKDLIIESKLPILAHDFKEQMGLYFENRGLFTPAIQEFTGFCCQVFLGDLSIEPSDDSCCYYEEVCKSLFGRYDNVPFYIQEERAKIGLIDLESLEPLPVQSLEERQTHLKRSCSDIITLFPYHFEEILEEAQTHGLQIDVQRNFLEEIRDKALERFRLTYVAHKEFILSKEITLEDPLAFKKEEIANLEELKRDLQSLFFNGFLEEGFDAAFLQFRDKVLPVVLDAAYSFIENLLKNNFEEKDISSWEKVLLCRSLPFNEYGVEYAEFKRAVDEELKEFRFKNARAKSEMVSELLKLCLQIFVTSKQIAYYNPSIGIGQCIFC